MKKNDLPSYEILEKILKNYHKASHTFLQLYRDRDKNNEIKVIFLDLRQKYLMGLHKFNHDVMLLRTAGVVEIKNQTIDYAIVKILS